MARTAQINFQRVTFSFPKRVVDLLREKVGQNNMSKYVAEVVEKELDDSGCEIDGLFAELDELQKGLKFKTKKSSLEILRDIRYGDD